MARYRPGVELIKEGRCPIRATTEYSCWVCVFGHPLECHYPELCLEAGCDAPKPAPPARDKGQPQDARKGAA